jgi:hypothetical protein
MSVTLITEHLGYAFSQQSGWSFRIRICQCLLEYYNQRRGKRKKIIIIKPPQLEALNLKNLHANCS